jgi:hypothetical protein
MDSLYIQFDNIDNPIQYCIDTILKEAKEESRPVKQLLYTMLSAYTNNIINLAINSPSGEGKAYVLQKVGELFPKKDTLFLAGMTEKALFHRPGKLVDKNEVWEYQPSENKLEEIDSLEIEKELRIVEQFIDPSCHILCRECVQNHGLKPNFEGIETSIDVVIELFRQSAGSSRKLKTHTSSKKTHYKTPEYKL